MGAEIGQAGTIPQAGPLTHSCLPEPGLSPSQDPRGWREGDAGWDRQVQDRVPGRVLSPSTQQLFADWLF
jgi:hypothetical protein